MSNLKILKLNQKPLISRKYLITHSYNEKSGAIQTQREVMQYMRECCTRRKKIQVSSIENNLQNIFIHILQRTYIKYL